MDVDNGYACGSREQTFDVTEANRQMEMCRQPVASHRKKDDSTGRQQLIEGDSGRMYECCRCRRTKPECQGARNFKYEEKKDGSALNSQEAISKKFQDLKEAIQKKKDGGLVTGATHTMQGEVVPSLDTLLMDEEPHDGNVSG